MVKEGVEGILESKPCYELKRKDVVENNDHPLTEGTWYIKEDYIDLIPLNQDQTKEIYKQNWKAVGGKRKRKG